MSGLVQIFAFGGGGFTHAQEGGVSDALLEERLLSLAGPVAQVNIGYIGHANNDNIDRILADVFLFLQGSSGVRVPYKWMN